MSFDKYHIRTMTQDELAIAIDWAGNEGWNPGLHDVAAFYRQDPGGFFIGILNGEPIGSISCVKYEGGFAFLGFYIVKSEFRGQGYGIQLWNHGIEYAQGYVIGLDGVKEQQPKYRKSGFELAYSNIRYEYTTRKCKTALCNLEWVEPRHVRQDELNAFDQQHFLFPRPHFLQEWLYMNASKSLVAKRDGMIYAIGTIRKCRHGFKIGPLFARSAQAAKSMFFKLTDFASPGSSVYLDIPEVNKMAVEFAIQHKMTPVFGTARMYSGKPPNLPVNQIWGVTTFELG